MGKSSAPATPDYKGQAIATANSAKYSQLGPNGSVTWSTKPGANPNNPQPGDYIQTTTLSPEQQALYDLQTANQQKLGETAQGLIPSATGSQQAMADAQYNKLTRYYDTNFNNREDALKTSLLNQGLDPNSEAYQKALGNFNQERDTAYADAADRALLSSDTAQNSAVNRLVQLMAASRGESPTTPQNGTQGVDYTGATQNAYNSNLASVSAENANTASTTGTVGTLALLAYMY